MDKFHDVVIPVFQTLLENGWEVEAKQGEYDQYWIRATRDDWFLSLITAEGLTDDVVLSNYPTGYFIRLTNAGELADFAHMSSEEIARKWLNSDHVSGTKG